MFEDKDEDEHQLQDVDKDVNEYDNGDDVEAKDKDEWGS